jgi:AGCS family alanine or glycine:cation symporter
MDGFSSFFAILMLCAGLFLSVRINFFQFTHLGCAIKTALGLGQRRAAENVRRKQKSDASGVTPFQALSSALGGSIGTANIAGVASAIAIGGAGAVFYMWLAALVGMGVKFCEIVLALRYREKRGGQWCGGAMLYIEKGFRKSNTGSRFLQSVSKPLAAGFALFGLLASSVGTPLVQSNTIAMSVNDAVLLFLPKAEQKTVCIIAGAVTAALVGIVILGGIKRIGKASEIIVPFISCVPRPQMNPSSIVPPNGS